MHQRWQQVSCVHSCSLTCELKSELEAQAGPSGRLAAQQYCFPPSREVQHRPTWLLWGKFLLHSPLREGMGELQGAPSCFCQAAPLEAAQPRPLRAPGLAMALGGVHVLP